MTKVNLKVEHENKIKPNDKHFTELYLILLMTQGIMKNPRQTDLYKKGYITERGEIKRMPKTQKEWDEFSLLEAFFIKMRYMLAPRMSELNEFRKLGSSDFITKYADRIKLNGVSSDFKMKMTNELLNNLLNIDKDRTIL